MRAIRRPCLLGRFNRIYGVGGRARSARQLPRQIRIHPRLIRRVRRRSMQTVRTMIGGRRGSAAPALRAALVAGRCAAGLRLQHRLSRSPASPKCRPTIGCAIRSRSREADRTLADLHRLQSRRADAVATRRAAGLRAELAARSDRRRGRSICRSAAATSAPPPTRLREIQSILVAERRAAAGRRRAQLPGRGRARWRPIRITYPKIAAQAGPCGVWPEDIGPSFNRDYFENQPTGQHRLRQPAQPRRDGR